MTHHCQEGVNSLFKRGRNDILKVLLSFGPSLVVCREQDLNHGVKLEVHLFLTIITWRVIFPHYILTKINSQPHPSPEKIKHP